MAYITSKDFIRFPMESRWTFFGSGTDKIILDPNSFLRDGILKNRYKMPSLYNRHNMQALPRHWKSNRFFINKINQIFMNPTQIQNMEVENIFEASTKVL